MFMCVVNQKSVNKLDLTWKQSFLIGLLEKNSGHMHALNLQYFEAKLPNLELKKMPHTSVMKLFSLALIKRLN